MTEPLTGADIRLPHVLFVDDEPETIEGKVRLALDTKATSEVLHPRQVELNHLEQADLVLVDFRITDWPERDETPGIALRPSNGLSLAALLREHADQTSSGNQTGFALHSGHLSDIAGRLPVGSSQHVVARFNNLEWAFQKNDPQLWAQVVTLATSIRDLPVLWPDDLSKREGVVIELLQMNPELDGFERAWNSVRECQPPMHELGGSPQKLAFIRWLLHKIFPYPTFLISEHWLAARLRITLPCLRDLIAGQSELGENLRQLEYSGILSGFTGKRWWRAQVDSFIWNLAQEHQGELPHLQIELERRAGRKLDFPVEDPPMVHIGETLIPIDGYISPDRAIRVQPDQWPGFAEDALASIDSLKTSSLLRNLVHPSDRYRLESLAE